MTDTPFTAAERAALGTLGLTFTGASAWAVGAMTVEAVPHGSFHYRLTVTLPGARRFSGFVPRSQILRRPSSDEEQTSSALGHNS